MEITKEIAIIGGGAAGFFAAINCKINYPSYNVTIYEKSAKLLSKVKISGGGRCNVTNATYRNSELSKNYPRGEKQLKKAFNHFNAEDTVKWFESRGVKLVTQNDNCIFPESQSSQTIIDCFMNECKQLGIEIFTKYKMTSIKRNDNGKLELVFNDDIELDFDKIIVSIGGQPKLNNFDVFEKEHGIIRPVPSLFTFNMPKEPIKELMGVVVETAEVRIQTTRLKDTGPLLITHWGMSGPAILKLSAWGARVLEKFNYKFKVQINWLKDYNYSELEDFLKDEIATHKNKIVKNQKIVPLPSRLWIFLLEKIDFNQTKKWGDLSKKEFNKLVNILQNDIYSVDGKTTFKEEFVTAGGIKLSDINFFTMQSIKMQGVYFAGEVIDIDGITGGFNFQNAWTTGFIAARLK
jgi:predicted Rossmann fold flavoprotein